MNTYTWDGICSLAVRQVGKPAVYVNNGLEHKDEKDDEIWDFIISSVRELYGKDSPRFYSVMGTLTAGGLFFFDSEEEQYEFYRIFEQPLTNSSAVYATTYGADGQGQTENT